MKRFFLIGACAITFSGCASMGDFKDSPTTVQGNVNAAVEDTKAVTTGAVAIAGDLAGALLAILNPITTIGATVSHF